MENSKEKRSCADCKYYEECVKGKFGNVPADACDFSDIIHHENREALKNWHPNAKILPISRNEYESNND